MICSSLQILFFSFGVDFFISTTLITQSIIHTKTNFYTSLFSSFNTQLPLKFPVKLKELELPHLPLLLFTKIHQIQQKISPIHQIQIRVVDVVVSSHVVKNVVGITLRTHFGGNWKIPRSTKEKTRRQHEIIKCMKKKP